MENINQYVGHKIRNYRKMKKMTLLDLAQTIHKSKATVSKYENGEISLDLQTLLEISQALDVRFEQLTDYHTLQDEEPVPVQDSYQGKSPFFKADHLYFYFYDGKYDRLKEAIIHIHKNSMNKEGCYEASMSIQSSTHEGRNREIYYSGQVLYSDMLIRFSFQNKYNKLEQDLLYIFNPLERREMTEGLLCGISSTDFMPCAYKCIVSLLPNHDYNDLKNKLLITSKELKRWQKMNMLIVDNNS